MAKVVFWISASVVFYVYFGYPVLLMIWKRLSPNPVKKGQYEPLVSVVIAARNERENIERKIRNCLSLDYPGNKLEIIISLDAPTDGTAEAVTPWIRRGVKVLYSPVHRGKAAAITRAVAVANGEVIVFADARQQVHPNAIRALVSNLNDPSIGAVSGELVLIQQNNPTSEDAHEALGFYWRYEKWIREMESHIHSAIGATGALYAIRRELFRPIPEGMILDDVFIPMMIVLAGKRVVFEPLARAYDKVACCPQGEFPRKVRTLVGNYQLLRQLPDLSSPRKNPVVFQFISHKLGRLVVQYALVMLFLSNAFLLQGFYLAAFLAQSAWYLLAAAGWLAVGTQSAQHAHKPLALGRS